MRTLTESNGQHTSCQFCSLPAIITEDGHVKQRDGMADGAIIPRPIENFRDIVRSWSCLCGYQNDIDDSD